MIYQRGDIVLLPYPYTDLSGTKKRPVIILTAEDRYGNHIVAKITSVLRNDAFTFSVQNSDLSTPFHKPSEVRVNELFTVDKSLIIKDISVMNRLTTEQLLLKVIDNFN